MTDDFRHRTRVQVLFRDLDAFAHVNNAVTASYVEQARVTYLRDVLGLDPVGNMPMILARQCLDYESPIRMGETVEIGSRVDWVGRSSIRMTHRLTADDAREVAHASAVLVAYDYQHERPMPVPETWRGTLAVHEGHSLDRPESAA